MKKITIYTILVLLLVLTCTFVACGDGNAAANLAVAKTAVEKLDILENEVSVADGLELPTTVSKHTVSWTITNGGEVAKIATDTTTGKVTIEIDDTDLLTKVSYVLTATITNANGDSDTVVFNLEVPANQSAIDAVTARTERTAALERVKTTLTSFIQSKIPITSGIALPITLSNHSVVWSVTNGGTTVEIVNSTDKATVEIDDSALLVALDYTLTATISNAVGENDTVSFNLQVPANQDAIEAAATAERATALAAAKAYLEGLEALDGVVATTTNYTVPTVYNSNNHEHAITWSIANGGTNAVLGTPNNGQVQISISDSGLLVDAEYVLTATIVNTKNERTTAVFNLKVPANVNPVVIQEALVAAKQSLETLYEDFNEQNTVNYSLVNNITGNSLPHSVSWSISVTSGDVEGAKVVVTSGGNVTVEIAKLPEEPIVYTLTGTITSVNGNTQTITYNCRVSSQAERLAAFVDYAGQVTLDMDSETVKIEVTVKTYVDGDTTHFNVPKTIADTGVLKARYLGINTPESTGQIEPYGKAASRYTKEKLQSATSIIIESDDGNWNLDSTGGRYLVWIWYKTADADVYRNLNIEILQNGLARASNSGNNRYGEICIPALMQSQALKLKVFSDEPDPEHYYGEAVELTLKELRANIEEYSGIKVAFEAVLTRNDGQTVYCEYYDAESDMYYGMAIYYGFNLSGAGLEILTPGNLVRIVGSLQYYETGGTYQVADLRYQVMRPNDPGNIQKIEEGHTAAYLKVTADTFNGKVTLINAEDVPVEYDFAELAMNTSISMDNLTVKRVYVTDNGGDSDGAMTLTCQAADGTTITLRTVVLYDENEQLIGPSTYLNKTIDIKGFVDYFSGDYQIKILNKNDITIH